MNDSYTHDIEKDLNVPNLIHPIVFDEDIPRANETLTAFSQALVNYVTKDADHTSLVNVEGQDSDTVDPMEEFIPPFHAQLIDDNMTEDDFYFSRDYRPHRYRPVPRPGAVLDPGRKFWPGMSAVDDHVEEYYVSAKTLKVKEADWKVRDALAMLPALYSELGRANHSAVDAARWPGLAVPRDAPTIREALRLLKHRAMLPRPDDGHDNEDSEDAAKGSPRTNVPTDRGPLREGPGRHAAAETPLLKGGVLLQGRTAGSEDAGEGQAGGGERRLDLALGPEAAMVLREGDHWPTRRLLVYKKLRRKGGAETSILIAGGPGQPRVWSQWVITGAAAGAFSGAALLFLTSARQNAV